MSDLIIKINKNTRKVTLSNIHIGNDHENLQENLIFQFDTFIDGQARLEYEINGTKNYIILQKENQTYTIPVKNVITIYQEETKGDINFQLVVTEGTEEENVPVFKSNIFFLKCRPSINAVTEAPEGYELWIEQANAKLNLMDEALQEVDNLDIDANKVGKVTSIIITKKDGTQKTINVDDGVSLEYLWQGTSLGIKREDEQNYVFVNLKGEKGDTGEAGAIKMLIVNQLPLTGEEGTLYFVPKADTEISDLYDEYMWVNNDWELVGEKQITVDLSDYYTKQETNNLLEDKADVEDIPDLTDYVKNTDYASSSKGGTIRTSNASGLGISNGNLYAVAKAYNIYNSASDNMFIGKGTLENVITGKELVNKTYVDNIVGDIDTILETLTVGGGVS